MQAGLWWGSLPRNFFSGCFASLRDAGRGCISAPQAGYHRDEYTNHFGICVCSARAAASAGAFYRRNHQVSRRYQHDPQQAELRPTDGRCTKTPHSCEFKVDVGTPAAEGEGEDGEDEAVAPSPGLSQGTAGLLCRPALRSERAQLGSSRLKKRGMLSKGGRVEAARGRPDGAYLTK